MTDHARPPRLLRSAILAAPLLLSVGLLAPSLPASAATTQPGSSSTASQGWFHDPLTAQQRAALVPVPTRPQAVHGKVRGTQVLYRTSLGTLAVPVSWAKGHQLAKGQAVVLDSRAVVGPRTTATTRQQVAQLAASLKSVTAVSCEGYSTYGGSRARVQKLALQRAVRVCNLLAANGHGPRTTSTGFGSRRPVLVGGTKAQRSRNNRVIVRVASVRAATKPPAQHAAAPGSPTLTTVTGGPGTVTLTFTPPSSTGGSPITGYQWSTNHSSWTSLTVTGTAPYSATLNALPVGTLTYYVRALNAVGPGIPSTGLPGTVTSVPVVTVPGAPTLSSVLGGVTSAVLGFTAPISDGGSAITGYQWSTDLTSWTPLTVTGSSPYSATLNALPVGTLTYYVRAVNSAGPGLPSAGLPGTVTSVPVVTVPGAPTLTSALGGITSMALGFTAPISDGGSAITGYQWSTDLTSWTPLTVTGSSPYSATLNALPVGTLTYYVRAVNSAGPGLPSAGLPGTVTSVPVVTVPGAPTLTSALGGITSMALGFTAPVSDGGSAITGYQWSTDLTTWTPLTVTGSSPYSVTLNSLPVGALTYYVRAVNAVGPGAPSAGLLGTVLPVLLTPPPLGLIPS